MAELEDVQRLRTELQELSQQRQQVNERLRNWDSRGRGGGGLPGSGPAWGPGPGRGLQQRLGSAPGAASDRFGGAAGRRDAAGNRNGAGFGRDDSFRSRDALSQAAPPPPLPSGPQKKLMSAVVVNGQTRMLRQQSDGAAAPPPLEAEDIGRMKRPAPSESEQNPAAQKRARRMFGALMGTLAKASAQEEQFQASGSAAKRQEAMQRVREREREERKRAREVARQKEIAEKQAEVAKIRKLRALADIKRLEIAAAERLRHRTLLAGFIRTKAAPPLHWLPAVHSEPTEVLLEAQQADLAEWKAKEVQRLEEEKAAILARRAPQLLQRDGADVSAAHGETGREEVGEQGDADAAVEAQEASDMEANDERWGGGAAPNRRDADDRWQREGAARDNAGTDGQAGADEGAADADADVADDMAAMDAHDTRHGREAETLEDLLQD